MDQEIVFRCCKHCGSAENVRFGETHCPGCGMSYPPSNCAFVPQEPVVIHGPLPNPLPQFEGIDYPIGGKPEEKRK